MMRALWTAASGMTSQQFNVDTISNNLANVNTTGYKKESANFKTLLYQTMSGPSIEGQAQRPTPLQVGLGVRIGGITRDYRMGSLLETGNPTDMAIEGKGFFAIQCGDEVNYTRDGSFRFAMIDEANYALVSVDGNPILSVDGEPIVIDQTIKSEDVEISPEGVIYYTDAETQERVDVAQLQLVQFANTAGLEVIGSNMYRETAASGEPQLEVEGEGMVRSSIRTKYLEGTNVQVADEMVNLIIAQRAYELNSTAIKTADSMLQQANELKRG